MNTKSAVPLCSTLKPLIWQKQSTEGPKINDWLCYCLIRLEVLCPGWTAGLSCQLITTCYWFGSDGEEGSACYLMCGVDLLGTCLSKMISTFTSEQTFFFFFPFVIRGWGHLNNAHSLLHGHQQGGRLSSCRRRPSEPGRQLACVCQKAVDAEVWRCYEELLFNGFNLNTN